MNQTTTDLTLTERLLISRRRAGVSTRSMAELLGVRSPTVSQYENGRNRPPLEVLRIWARVCGVSRDWLAFGADDDEDGVVSLPTFRPLLAGQWPLWPEDSSGLEFLPKIAA
jgi:transcriptional regulator with XRE-family HTH domain